MSKAGEWQVVYRRKNEMNNRKNGENLISFFVGNIPDGCGVRELRETFKGFGNLANVYMTRKKDKGGSNFGFIRYADVSNVKKFEESFGKVYMGCNVLVINVSRYQRKLNFNHVELKQSFKPMPPPPSTASTFAWDFRGKRSFANVVSSGNNVTSKNLICVKLCPSQELDRMLSDKFLVGEVHDSEILKALPNLLKDEGINFGRVFFYGGLYVLIGFDEISEALGLIKNKDCWSKWFNIYKLSYCSWS